jgi:hypothetical protein
MCEFMFIFRAKADKKNSKKMKQLGFGNDANGMVDLTKDGEVVEPKVPKRAVDIKKVHPALRGLVIPVKKPGPAAMKKYTKFVFF